MTITTFSWNQFWSMKAENMLKFPSRMLQAILFPFCILATIPPLTKWQDLIKLIFRSLYQITRSRHFFAQSEYQEERSLYKAKAMARTIKTFLLKPVHGRWKQKNSRLIISEPTFANNFARSFVWRFRTSTLYQLIILYSFPFPNNGIVSISIPFF